MRNKIISGLFGTMAIAGFLIAPTSAATAATAESPAAHASHTATGGTPGVNAPCIGCW